jgi:hypothetical protein
MSDDINSIRNFLDHQHIKASAIQVPGRAVRLVLSRRDYPSEIEMDEVIHGVWKRFGEDMIVPQIRR